MAKKREIYAINPKKRRKRRKTTPKKSKPERRLSTMARKRRRTTKKRRSYKRNPSPKRKTARRARATVGRMFGGLSFKKALANMPATQIGMWAAKKAARSFIFGDATNYATENDAGSWNWASYVKGSLGGVGAALLVNMLKPGMGQKVLEGAANLMVYKALMNEVVYKSETLTAHFGADEDADEYSPEEYLLTGANDDWFLGTDGGMYPTNDMYRLPEASMDGNAIVPVGPLGDVLTPVGPLGYYGDIEEAYRKAYFNQI